MPRGLAWGGGGGVVRTTRYDALVFPQVSGS